MAKGISLHIGLNRVDATHYNGWPGTLRACEADARSMETLARANGYKTNLLLTAAATAQAVKAGVSDAAQKLTNGDIFLFTYSGHGGQIPDTNGGDEDDGMDETWVLFDRMMVDDELHTLWSEFKPGVRIFVLSDSCHSGTVLRAFPLKRLNAIFDFSLERTVSPKNNEEEEDVSEFKAIPDEVQRETYLKNRSLYDRIQAENPREDKSAISASVLLISGCQDNQLSKDGLTNGLFTGTMLKVWNNGGFAGNYDSFHKEIKRRMPPIQTPELYKVGVNSPAFDTGKPFVIGGAPSGGIIRDDEDPSQVPVGTTVISTSGSTEDIVINITIS